MSCNHHVFSLDGHEIPFRKGQTIMDAALAAGVYIPHLCHFPGIPSQGNCKLCTVKIGTHKLAACTALAEHGTAVESEIKELVDARRTLTQMLFIEGNHICPSCEKTGNCSLQAMAYHLGMQDNHYPQFFPQREVDASHPTIWLDRDRCILCSLCVRASQSVDGKNVFAIAGRGLDAQIIVNSPTGKLIDSELTPDDLAARICPVGAILIKEVGYQVPIGDRIFDRHAIDEIGLEEVILTHNAPSRNE